MGEESMFSHRLALRWCLREGVLETSRSSERDATKSREGLGTLRETVAPEELFRVIVVVEWIGLGLHTSPPVRLIGL
jgi:hypothetical protein